MNFHLDAVAKTLVATLQELNVPNLLIQEVGALAESIRGDVLNL